MTKEGRGFVGACRRKKGPYRSHNKIKTFYVSSINSVPRGAESSRKRTLTPNHLGVETETTPHSSLTGVESQLLHPFLREYRRTFVLGGTLFGTGLGCT